jgi:hypothetical protein
LSSLWMWTKNNNNKTDKNNIFDLKKKWPRKR